MKTYTTLTNLFTNLSNNTSASNFALGGQLISDQHRYLVQKYFDNERTYTTKTIGAEQLTTTLAIPSGATIAILTSPWESISCVQKVVFSNSDQRDVVFTQDSNVITWQTGLNSAATTELSTIGVQGYPIPPQVSKIKNDTITVGQLQYTPAPVRSIQEWTQLNALPYTSDIPNYYYIYNNQVMFWPIPSTSGNLITFNHKSRVPDLSFSDYNTGTLADIEVGSNIITGVGTSFSTTGKFPLGVDLGIFNLNLKIDPPNGDGIWYQIKQFNSETEVVLYQPIQSTFSATANSYTIGQLPLLQEDFQDMLVFGALKIYFSSIKQDDKKYNQFSNEYQTRLLLLEDYAGTKSVNVDLGSQPIPNNPNLYLYASPQ